jgi:hypothetical protein
MKFPPSALNTNRAHGSATIVTPYRWYNTKTTNPLQEIADAADLLAFLGFDTPQLFLSYRTLDHIRSHFVPEATLVRVVDSIKELCGVALIQTLDMPLTWAQLVANRIDAYGEY